MASANKIVEEYVDVPHVLPGIALDSGEAARIAARLNGVTTAETVSILSRIPASWGITDRELESIGYYIERRAPQVAARLSRQMGGGR